MSTDETPERHNDACVLEKEVRVEEWKNGETESTDHRCFLRLGLGFLGLCK